MTKFNPKQKKTLSYEETCGPAMQITDPDDAMQYFKDYVAFIQQAIDKRRSKKKPIAIDLAKSNLGYYAGYYDGKVQERVYRLFNCCHPIFGGAVPTPQKALNTGRRMDKKVVYC